MLNRIWVSLAAVAGALLAITPADARSQLSVGVNLSWHWSEGDWQPRRYVDGYRNDSYGPRPTDRRYASRPAIRIPPGHLPPPGACRLWYVGRPPGHQPPPTSCARLFRSYRQPGVIILQGPPPRGQTWSRAYGYDPHLDAGPYYEGPRSKEKMGKGPKGKRSSRGRGG